ncbi:LPD38 domain-containing protein [Cohnella sp. GCM10020058]|uniref:LPD38 domain-containing protein n=1 Tax=Cohnella sp. GCM10020058 TaxID=3317330 RepID=UPI00364531E5
MAESFIEKRRRELGLDKPAAASNATPARVPGAQASPTVAAPTSFVGRRRLELGIDKLSPQQLQTMLPAGNLSVNNSLDTAKAFVGSKITEATKQKAAEKQQKEEALNRNAYEKWYDKHIGGTWIDRALGGLQTADRAVSDVKAGALDTATIGASQGLGRLAINSLPGGEQNLKPIFDERKDSVGYTVGEIAGYLPPGAAIERGIAAIGKGVGKRFVKSKIGRTAIRGAAAGAVDAAAQEAGDVAFREGKFDPVNVAIGAGAGGALGAGAEALSGALRSRALNKEVKSFINRVESTDAPSPVGRNVQELPGSSAQGDAYAANARRWLAIQDEHAAAVDQQYQYLKQSLKERGGVQQGGLVKDPTTGEVTGRYGRTSNNPQWYRDFYAATGRKPTDKDLRTLAIKQVNEGFADDAVNVPPWKPSQIEDIDGEIASIRGMLDNVTDPAERQALENVADTLAVSRAQIRNQLPEGVRARTTGNAAPASAPASGSAAAPSLPGGVQARVAAPSGQRSAGPSGSTVKPKKTISRAQMVERIRQNMGVTIDSGRTGKSRQQVLGIYKIQPEVIRTGYAEDVETIAHELGHHLSKKHALLDRRFEQELLDMMDTQGVHNYRSYPRNVWHEEGIAEFLRTYLTDPDQARQLSPRFSEFLESQLPKNVRKGLGNVQQDVQTWINQGEYEQAKGLLDFDGGGGKPKGSWDRWYTRFVDDLNPIKIAEKALSGAVGVGKDSIYKMARLSRGVGEQAKMAVTRGIFSPSGRKMSDGLQQIVKPLQKIGMSEKDFGTYLAVIHAEDLKNVHKKEIPFSDAQIRAVKQRWGNNPVVQKAQQEIVKYNNALLDLMVDSGLLPSKAVTEMRTKYPNYVPFMRYFDDDAVAGFKNGGYGSSSGFANVTTPVKRMSGEGSDRTIINPIESMVQNTFLTMNAAAKNKVGLQLAELAKIDGAGKWVEHVPGASDPGQHIVFVKINGDKQAFKIRDPELYNAMLSLDNESSNSLLRFLGGMASALRGGATLTPEFMIRNAFRDVAGAMVNSTKYGFTPLDFLRGFMHTVKKSDVYEKFVNSGGAMSTMMALDRDTNREALEAVFKKSLKDKTLNVVTSPKELAKWLSLYRPVQKTVDVLRKGAEISELSTKVGAFNRVLKKTGSVEEAAYSARDLMDFNRAGSNIRQANKAIAFLNASIQGTDKMARAFKDNPASFLVRAFTTLALPASLIYLSNRYLLSDEDKMAYENIPQWQKDSFFVLGVGGGKFVRIPKPFEAGMLFATSTERMLQWLEANDPEAFEGYGRATAESLTPPMLFTALTPLLEATTNHSFFRNAPIVPQGEQRYEKKDQYGIYTSEVAKELGQLADKVGLGETNAASPRIIDNTLKGYTAGLGQYGVDAVDKVIDKVSGKKKTPEPAKQLTESPFFRSFFATTSGGGQVREDFYDAWDKISKKKASADRDDQILPIDQQRQYMRMKAGYNAINKLNKRYKAVRDSKDIDAETKRSKMDELDAKMNEAAAKALEAK